jgi:DNA invertase Pin-like site-specific DNA recombinase
MRQYRTQEQLEQEQKEAQRKALGNIFLDTEKLLLIYARQSSSKQYVSNIYSAMEQRDGLLEKASTLGWIKDEQWVLYVENQLAKKTKVSGSLRIDQRPGLQALTEVIESGKASAVLVVSIDRITRDEDLITPTQFANLCKVYHVLIITDDYTYDFNNPNRDDMGRFMIEAIASKEYIRKQIKGKMIKNRTCKASMGRVANGNAPVGLMLDPYTLDEKGKPYTLIPSPHAEKVDWLYTRFRYHNASLTSLFREVVNLTIQGIPLFEYDERIDPQSIHLDLLDPTDEKSGWTIKSRYGLKYLLTNPQYIGTFVWIEEKNEKKYIVKPDHHSAIVDANNWHYAFEHLSDRELDGTPIERTEKAVRYTQRGNNNNALLSGTRHDGRLVVDGLNGAHVYYNDTMKSYLLLNRTVPSVYGFETSVTTKELDAVIEAHLLLTLELCRRKGKVGCGQAYQVMSKVERTQQQQASSVPDDLTLTEQDLATVQRLLKFPDSMDDTRLEETLAKEKRLKKRRAELLQAQSNKARLEAAKEQASRDIECAYDKWHSWTIEERRSFLQMVTDNIILEEIASGWLRVTIVWSSLTGFNSGTQSVGYVWRSSGSQWIETEEGIIRALYPNSPRSEILHALPSRSWASIVAKARKLNPPVARLYTKHESNGIPQDMSISDMNVLREFMLKPGERVQWHKEQLTNADILPQFVV